MCPDEQGERVGQLGRTNNTSRRMWAADFSDLWCDVLHRPTNAGAIAIQKRRDVRLAVVSKCIEFYSEALLGDSERHRRMFDPTPLVAQFAKPKANSFDSLARRLAFLQRRSGGGYI